MTFFGHVETLSAGHGLETVSAAVMIEGEWMIEIQIAKTDVMAFLPGAPVTIEMKRTIDT